MIITLRALRVCPRSSTWGTGLGVTTSTATGPVVKPPDPAPLNPEPHVAFAPLAAVALSPTPPVEEKHHEARQKGNRNPAG